MKSPTLLSMSRIPVAEVVEQDRLRPVSEAGVASLLASIAETGVMKDAIHVRKKKDGKLYLIAGGHRLEAARRLGWAEIEAKVWTGVTDDWARLMEIDDNLAGAEMDALDTAVFLAERKQVYERLHPNTKRGVAGALARWDATELGSVAFVTATALKFGLSDRQVRKIAAAGLALDAANIGYLRSAKRPVLLKDLIEISKIGETSERNMVVLRLSSGNAKSAAEARRTLKAEEMGVQPAVKDTVEEAYLALAKLWSRTPKDAKRRFVHEFGGDLAALEGDGA